MGFKRVTLTFGADAGAYGKVLSAGEHRGELQFGSL